MKDFGRKKGTSLNKNAEPLKVLIHFVSIWKAYNQATSHFPLRYVALLRALPTIPENYGRWSGSGIFSSS
jgi:hypothetical protein